MVSPSSRFHRCLCLVIIASMLLQTGCYSAHKTSTHPPTEAPDTLRPLLESGVWYLEVGLREESVIKITSVNSEFGEVLKLWKRNHKWEKVPAPDSTDTRKYAEKILAERLKTPKVSGWLFSWDEETIHIWKEGVSFRGTRKADVVYEIPVEDVTKIIYTKSGKKFSPGKTFGATAAIIVIGAIYTLFALGEAIYKYPGRE